WMLTQIILFLTIPSAVLTKEGSINGVRYSEVLVRSRYRKILILLIVRAIIAIIPLLIIQGIEQTVIEDFFLGSNMIVLNTTITPDMLYGFLILPLIFLTLSIMSAWQLIMFEEENLLQKLSEEPLDTKIKMEV
ncbi:MAG: hypothetical protein ACXAC7_22615, partial [Candidatus Hodarchaeales archaeon]